jgi:hypothetical protein
MTQDDELVERERVSAVLVVDNDRRCDAHAAQLLIAFAAPEVKALSRRRTLGQVRETLLWCAFALNHAARDATQDTLALLGEGHGTETRNYVAHLFRRRLAQRASATSIGPIRVTRLKSGAVTVYVDSAAELKRTAGTRGDDRVEASRGRAGSNELTAIQAARRRSAAR